MAGDSRGDPWPCPGRRSDFHRHRRSAELAQILAECLAYSDSINDLPLLELVGQPQVVNPDRRLRQVADARGWPVREVRSVRTKNRRRRPTAA